MKSLTLVLLVLLVLTVACTAQKAAQQTTGQNNAQQAAQADDVTSNLVINDPQDPGMLDNTTVSDEIPQ